MQRSIVHIDMDAFFASVEQRDDPRLRGHPVLVGRLHRGVVTAASYEARPFGARSAMPMAQAMRACPHAKVVPPRFAAYRAASAAVFAIFARYTPQIEALSIDEAFLDVTGSLALFGSARAIAERIRSDIRVEVGLAASAGVAPNKFVAKLASEWDKPDGLTVLEPDEVAAKLAPLSVRQLLGIGPKGAQALQQAGFSTFADVRAATDAALTKAAGRQGPALRALAWGLDDRPVVAGRAAKSVGSEHTLDDDVHDPQALRAGLLRHALKVASRLSASGHYAGGVTLKLKSSRFVLVTRQAMLAEASADPDVLFECAWQLLQKAPLPPEGVRLVGLSAHALQAEAPARQLFVPDAKVKHAAAEKARLAIERRFGSHGLTRASLLPCSAPPAASRMPRLSTRLNDFDPEESEAGWP